MKFLSQIVDYWYDCIRNEDILEKDISINVRKKAVLYPFDRDSFIFEKEERVLPISGNERLAAFCEYVNTTDYEAYYGYPLLFYYNDVRKRHLIAPVLLIKVAFVRSDEVICLRRDEPYPTLGIQALNRLGLRTEQIADLSQSVGRLFESRISDMKDLSRSCLEVVQKESEVEIREPLDPSSLTNSTRLSKNMAPGLYNKSLVFAADKSVYNVSLLEDLLELKDRKDLEHTALSYLLERAAHVEGSAGIPILPFPSNEYQIRALRDIFQNRLSVITGPPGTGKSQYIANLLVNLFLQGKSVLLVSHTNEAVDVVNTRMNQTFRNLMIRTGKKEFRQDLEGKFNELILDSQRTFGHYTQLRHIRSLWKTITAYRNKLIELDTLQAKFQEVYFDYNAEKDYLWRFNFLSNVILLVRKLLLGIRLRYLKWKLEGLPSKMELEHEARNLETRFYESSKRYVRGIYVHKMLGRGGKIGKVKSFLDQVKSSRFDKDVIRERAFRGALDVLKVWSSTLKSVRRTFPLAPGIFDYVIFDEASQVDLPSAAPALYRAKRAIVVGDPQQLTHVAGITRGLDKEIATIHGLDQRKDVYPSKIRYCDVPLYKSAEKSLTYQPVLLANHYRSEDEIISLCNRVFYKRRLKIVTTLDYSQYPHKLPLGVCWIDCQGEVLKHISGSRINRREVQVVNGVFQDILHEVSGTNLNIGVVTPYSRQQDAIQTTICQSTSPEVLGQHDVKIKTAHQFQGSERDIMIFSLVLASQGNATSDRWYNIYPQILNVALSRAKYLLYIVGDKNFCHARTGILRQLTDAYDEIKKQEESEAYTLHEKFDSPTERFLWERLQDADLKSLGYDLIPKMVVKRYTLDFALVGKSKFDIECDGCQHEMIEGVPVLEDVERDSFLKKEGWHVLRFPNHKILSRTASVLEEILRNLRLG